MSTRSRRAAAVLCLTGLLVSSTATAAEARRPPRPPKVCKATVPLTLINFNDFHGRIAASGPDTAVFFAAIEQQRAAAKNSLLLSAGDNVGGTLFTSAVADDQPTIDVLNAADLDASAIGNHEFDKGAADLADRIIPAAEWTYLSANIYRKGTLRPAYTPYVIKKIGGLRVGIIGATTADLPSLVAPDGIATLDIGDPVSAVNRYAAQLSDGRAFNGEADVLVATYHEGAPGEGSLAADKAESPIFARIVDKTSAKVAVVYTAHTHLAYTYDAPTGNRLHRRPVVQSASYGSLFSTVNLTVDKRRRFTTCAYTAANITPAVPAGMTRDAFVAQYPRAAAIDTITKKAITDAAVIGSRVIGSTDAPITVATTGDRNRESAMSNMVARMYRANGGGGDTVIGVQNPGGTRASFDAGDITYAEAASVLPFANTLMTGTISGAQLKTLLEQQWQRDASGAVPARPYLQLGLSENVSYTYDEGRAEGERITSVTVAGQPVRSDDSFTIVTNSFLMAGGDNFRVLQDAADVADTGKVDLEAWVAWLTAQGSVSPSYAKQAVSVSPAPMSVAAGSSVTFAVGVPQGPLAPDTLDMTTLSGVAAPNTTLVATLGGTEVGRANVTDGSVAALTITVPDGTPAGAAMLTLTVADSGTVVRIPITVG